MPKKQQKIVRMAPSPTGHLHVGTARTTLFNYLFAKHNNAKFIMRIEDTDRARSTKEFEKSILDSLSWLGIKWDGKAIRQSERTEIYKKYIKQLLDNGHAFYCWHTKEELKKERDSQMKQHKAPHHFCQYRDLPKEKANKKDSVIRLKNNFKGKIKFNDQVRGDIEFEAETLGDFAIAKNETSVLYNLAVVIDDHEMNVTDVIRGEDHIPNTPRQIILHKVLQLNVPTYAHIPLLLGPDRSRLSKRHGAKNVIEYKEEGYLPETLFNFLALLGWRPQQDEKEIMSQKEIIKKFKIEDIQKSPAIFDVEKLDWMNANYLREKSLDEFLALCLPYLVKEKLIDKNYESRIKNKDKEYKHLKQVVALEQKRIKKLSDITGAVEFVFKMPKYDTNLLVWKKSTLDDLIEVLGNLNDIIKEIPQNKWKKDQLHAIIMPKAEITGDRGSMLWPLRAALSGKKASPGPFEIMEVLGKEESLKRVKTAKSKAEKLHKNDD